VIAHCGLLYFRFPLPFHGVEELGLQRGVIVSHETVRRWCLKFGQAYTDGLRRCRPAAHGNVTGCVKINGVREYVLVIGKLKRHRPPRAPMPSHGSSRPTRA
jgi:putative transposase